LFPGGIYHNIFFKLFDRFTLRHDFGIHHKLAEPEFIALPIDEGKPSLHFAFFRHNFFLLLLISHIIPGCVQKGINGCFLEAWGTAFPTPPSPLRGAVGPPAECAARLRLAGQRGCLPGAPLAFGWRLSGGSAWRSLEIEGIFKLKNHFPALFII